MTKKFRKADATRDEQLTEERRRPRPRVIHRRIPEGDFQSVTLEDGARFYLTVKEKDAVAGKDPVKSVMEQNAKSTGLCGVSYSTLLEQAFTELSKIQQKSGVAGDETMDTDPPCDDSGVESMEEENEELWVEKFRPKSYKHLLSDDGTNRVLLKWLKLWDKVVFGREVRVRNKNKKEEGADPNHNKKGKKDAAPGNAPPGNKKPFQPFQAFDIDDELDDTHRPKLKVAMLHGPPGVGKTTLAHVIANHAGYNVVEMNASDDRSLQAFKNKLENATQMRSVNSRDQRPNCLIIDEIDGAPAPTINHLVGIVTGSASKGKKKAKVELLQRPIICICNDLYVPALRPLKQHCMMVSRLYCIATKRGALTELSFPVSLSANAVCSSCPTPVRHLWTPADADGHFRAAGAL